VTELEEEERARPGFKGKIRPNIVTQEPETYATVLRQFALQTLSYLLSSTFLLAVIMSMIGVITFRIIMEQAGGTRNSVIPSIVSTVIIYIFGAIYNAMAYRLTDMENHRTQTQYNDALINKLFTFSFVNNFTPLFYLAFLREAASKNGLWGDAKYTEESCQGDCMSDVSIQVASLLIGTPLIKSLTENLLPQVLKKLAGTRGNMTWFETEQDTARLLIGRDHTLQEYSGKMIQYVRPSFFWGQMPTGQHGVLLGGSSSRTTSCAKSACKHTIITHVWYSSITISC